MNIETVVRALRAHRSGSCWMARCPAHDDRDPSLSIREVDGKVLLHCHAGADRSGLASVLMISIRNITGAIHGIGPAKCAVYLTTPCFRMPTTLKYTKEINAHPAGT